MGSGEFGSNGSVHWQVSYDDREGAPADHIDYDIKRHPDNPKPPPPSDPPIQEIGMGKPGGNHQGKFRITARFQNPGQARAALQKALSDLKPSSSVVILDVDLRAFRSAPGPSSEWEVRVDW